MMIRFSLLLLLCAVVSGNIFTRIGESLSKDFVTVTDPLAKGVFDLIGVLCPPVKDLFGISYEDEQEQNREPDLSSLSLVYHDPSVTVTFNISTAAEKIVSNDVFNKTKKLFIFIHGFTSSPSQSSFSNISTALMATGESQVLALDASELIASMYLRSSTNVQYIGEKMGDVLTSMVEAGADPAKIHIIGHSLGAQISGFAGKQLYNDTGLKVGRISGLDPAGPCFVHIDTNLRLSASDADFVDVVHSNAGVLGIKDSIGHVDFYPNGGTDQTGCTTISCCHGRSWLYYAESILNEQSFPAVKCDSWKAFKKGECEEELAYMGYPVTNATSGNYYFQTDGDTPFSLGVNGTTYVSNVGLLGSIQESIDKLMDD